MIKHKGLFAAILLLCVLGGTTVYMSVLARQRCIRYSVDASNGSAYYWIYAHNTSKNHGICGMMYETGYNSIHDDGKVWVVEIPDAGGDGPTAEYMLDSRLWAEQFIEKRCWSVDHTFRDGNHLGE